MLRLNPQQRFVAIIFALSCILLILLLTQLKYETDPVTKLSATPIINFPTSTGNASVCYVPHREEIGPLSPLVTPIPNNATIMHDVGTICFSKISNSRLTVQVGSAGCFSSTCSVVYERNGNMKIDEENRQIMFTSYFAVEPYQPTDPDGRVCACTANCGGAGMTLFDTGDLQEGTYPIILGEKQIGEIQIPFISASSSICFSTD